MRVDYSTPYYLIPGSNLCTVTMPCQAKVCYRVHISAMSSRGYINHFMVTDLLNMDEGTN